jgi:hypothetical protein
MSLGKRFARRLSAEHGGILVLFAGLLPFFLALGALTVDVGNWYVHKRHLQTQVDAAALAGGGLFGQCFKPGAVDPNGDIYAEATKYNGDDTVASIFNDQVGGATKGTVTVWYQKTTYPAGGQTDPDSWVAAPPCDNMVLDVKGSEQDLPYIFFGSVVPRINAHARVQLNKVTIAKGSMPLAVPEVNPKYVTATFVDEAGNAVAGPVSLSGPTQTGSLNAWTGAATVNVPAGAQIGVRIGLGQLPGACAAANGTGGTGYVCYGYENHSIGLVSIAGFEDAGTPLLPDKRAFEVWPITACSGSPFFSDESLAGGATSCAVGVQANLHFLAGLFDPALIRDFSATITGPGFNRTVDFSLSGGVWSTGYAFDLPSEEGPFDISINWHYTGGVKATYSVHQIHSGGDDAGPVKVVSLSGGGGGGAPYALPAGSQTVTVNVAVEGTLHLSGVNETVMLRLTGGSRTSAIACDGPGATLFRDAIVSGCKTPYQINAAGYCPDPAPPPGPATCVPTQTGSMAGPTLQGLDERFSTCPPYLYPGYVDGDPRLVRLLITDFSALGGSGTTEVPVTNIAMFYVAGWTGSKCANPPPPFAVKKGAIWGHFVKYAGPDPTSVGTVKCVADAITPCVSVMTR